MSSQSSHIISQSLEQLQSWLNFIKTVPVGLNYTKSLEENIHDLIFLNFEEWVESMIISDYGLKYLLPQYGNPVCRASCKEGAYPEYDIQLQGTLPSGNNTNLVFSFQEDFEDYEEIEQYLEHIEKGDHFGSEIFKLLGTELLVRVACRIHCSNAQEFPSLTGQYERRFMGRRIGIWMTDDDFSVSKTFFHATVWKLVVTNPERDDYQVELKQLTEIRKNAHGEQVEDMFKW